jgi:hypothetical protein
MSRIVFLYRHVTRQGIKIHKLENKPTVPEDNLFFDYVKDCAEVFQELIKPPATVNRFLGNSSFRCDKGFPSFRRQNQLFVSRRNIDKRFIGRDGFVPVYWDGEELGTWDGDKPSVDTPIQVRLYDFFDLINYMVHSHVYIEGATFTTTNYPCGALEEVKEIIKAVQGDFTTERFAVNLIGHGSLIGGNSVRDLKGYKFYARPAPEIRGCL